MDFSWVKELADAANQGEEAKKIRARREKEDRKVLAYATGPFVEKLYLVILTASDEFNKYVNYSHLKVEVTRVQKRIKSTAYADEPELAYPEESSYFTFSRNQWTYGIRGINGLVEFVEFPTAGGSLGFRLDEVNVNPSRKLTAELDPSKQQIIWRYRDDILDGRGIGNLCKEYFREFIERSNE